MNVRDLAPDFLKVGVNVQAAFKSGPFLIELAARVNFSRRWDGTEPTVAEANP